MSSTPLPTMYHDSVDDFRRELAEASSQFRKDSETYFPERTAGPATRDAYVGSLMACSYSYALAAVLGVAAKEFGDGVAHRLANVADDLLANGDDDPGHNADVTPEKETTR